jgi:DNA-binding transcriptional MerR regulator/effector-binding domain-containing protein
MKSGTLTGAVAGADAFIGGDLASRTAPAGRLDSPLTGGSRLADMQVQLAIGDFSRMTYLSVKALRHYHEVGLLAPSRVDPATGYRQYDVSQVPVAQVIRRFRDLGMPIEGVKAVLQAPDVASRNEVIVAHLGRMESELARTQSTVASLRNLLERTVTPITVEHRSVPLTRALAIGEQVAMDDIEGWWSNAFEELYGLLRSVGVSPAGPGGALYPTEFFEFELGEVVAFVPVANEVTSSSRAVIIEVPPAELAITVHAGPFSELDQAYGALGTYVAERELGVEGPIREHYLVTATDTEDETQHRTEVCWPVFQTAPTMAPTA